jgi:hypothetical protein
VAGSGEYGNELLGSIKYWEFLEWLSSWWILKKGYLDETICFTIPRWSNLEEA